MKIKALLLLIFVVSIHCVAQTTDSIKYENGYLFYHEYGAKDFPPVVILTGGPGNSYNQLETMAKTLSSKFRCILPEQRGTGKSIPSPFDSTTISVNLLTKDIKKLIDILNIKKPILIGHSWGGTLAMNFAAQFPNNTKHLILIAPGPHKNGKRGFDVLYANRTHTRSFDEEHRLKNLNELIQKNQASASDILESQKLARRAYIFENPIPDSVFYLINAERNSKTEQILTKDIFKSYDVSKSLNNYKGQIDIISGRQDVVGFFSYELKLDRPNANLHWINKCGHFPMYEQPTMFY